MTSTTEAVTGTRLLVVVLAALTAVTPLATDIYVPALPELAASLPASEAAVQLTMTAFLVGLAVGQLVFGPVSDRVGRKPVLVVGASAFVVLSVVCALASSVEVLVVARLLQGMAGAAGIVVARAMITDRFAGPAAARRFAVLAAIVFVAPIVAPGLGGALLGLGPWPWVFVALAVIGVVLLAGVLWLPESLPVTRRTSGGAVATVRATGRLLTRRALVGCILVLGLGFGAFFTYVAGATFVFQGIYGLSDTQFSLVFMANAVGMLAAGIVFGRLAGRVSLRTVVSCGLGLALSAAVALLLLGGLGFGATWACLFVMVFAFGLCVPALVTLSQELGRDAPGATSGLVGCGQFVFGAAAAPLTGLFGAGSVTPLAVIMVVGFGCAVLVWATLGGQPAQVLHAAG